ncbi:ZIP family metal transporter [Thermincola ferriacetica]
MSYIFLTSIVAGLATCLGSFIVICMGRPAEKTFSLLFGLAGGIMLAVVVMDLIPSSLAYGSIKQALTGFSFGIMLMVSLDILLDLVYRPLTPLPGAGKKRLVKMGYLIAIGIALHDLPEGFAIAAGYSAKNRLGLVIATAIGLHNIPEGMATAVPLRMSGVSGKKILAINLLVSLFTPLGTYIGLLLVNISPGLITCLLSLAAGAMAYIVKNEILPESRKKHPNFATLGAMAGFLLIFALDFLHV